jgi:hypothetical protein
MSDTYTHLVFRLRRTDKNRGVPICSEAADEIERLIAEIARLKQLQQKTKKGTRKTL